jgi:hypothetical protein
MERKRTENPITFTLISSRTRIIGLCYGTQSRPLTPADELTFYNIVLPNWTLLHYKLCEDRTVPVHLITFNTLYVPGQKQQCTRYVIDFLTLNGLVESNRGYLSSAGMHGRRYFSM